MLLAMTANTIEPWKRNQPMSVDRIISVESGGNPNARNPRSTATGAGQFIESTWVSMMQKYRPDLIQNLGRDQILALRTNPELSREMTANYANENKGILGQAGLPVTDGTAYLAHFAGPQGAVKVLQADPSAPVGGILGDQVVRANPFLANMTAGDLAAWADKKMGAAPAMPQAPQQPPMQPPMQAPMQQPAPMQAPQQGLAPQAGQGILAPSQEAGGLFGGFEPSPMPKPMAPLEHLPIHIPPTLYQRAQRKAPSGAFSFRG